MPVSHELKCIFVHVPKAAGTSIENALEIYGPRPGLPTPYDPERLFGPYQDRFLQHLTAKEIRETITPEVYDSYFSFGFVRNPYDRVISEFFYRRKGYDPDLEFKKFLHEMLVPGLENPALFREGEHFFHQREFLLDPEGKPRVNFIGRFENLAADFAYVAEKVGCKNELPHIDGTVHRDYREYFDEEDKQLVAKLCAPDIDAFEYSFDPN